MNAISGPEAGAVSADDHFGSAGQVEGAAVDEEPDSGRAGRHAPHRGHHRREVHLQEEGRPGERESIFYMSQLLDYYCVCVSFSCTNLGVISDQTSVSRTIIIEEIKVKRC